MPDDIQYIIDSILEEVIDKLDEIHDDFNCCIEEQSGVSAAIRAIETIKKKYKGETK